MGRRKRDRSGDRLEALLKLGLLGLFLISLAIGGVKGFPHVFGTLASGLLVLVLAGAAFAGVGAVVAHLVRRRRGHLQDAIPPSIASRNASAPASSRNDFALSRSGESATFSHELLHEMEWKRLEQVASSYFEFLGFRTETARVGADGGIDIKLFKSADPRPAAIVQCKAWNTYKVGVKPIRELFGVMAAEGVREGIFVTTSSFSGEAREFADGKALELIDGSTFLEKIRQLPADAQTKLLGIATDGDYTTPTCPSCARKMVERTAGKGTNAGSKFWGCRNYPHCKQTFKMTTDRQTQPQPEESLVAAVASPPLPPSPSSVSLAYFYTVDGIEHGPVNRSRMAALLRSGRVTPFHKIERNANGVRSPFDPREFQT